MHLQLFALFFAIYIAGKWRISIGKSDARCFCCLASHAQTSPPVVAISDPSSPVVAVVIDAVASKIHPENSDHLSLNMNRHNCCNEDR